jgi:hypothetical protein
MKNMLKSLMENETLKPDMTAEKLFNSEMIGPSAELKITPIEGEMEDGNFEISLTASVRTGGMTEADIADKFKAFWKTIDIDATEEKKEEEKENGAEEGKPEGQD